MDEPPKTTPKAAKILAGALEMHGWDQLKLAELSKVNRATVSMHLAGQRIINNDHLAAYMAVPLDNAEKVMLLSAWLQDTLPLEAQEIVLSNHTSTVREEVQTWRPGISPEQQSMLRFWADKLAADDELDSIFAAISRKAGWKI